MIRISFGQLLRRLLSDNDCDPITRNYCFSRFKSEGISFLTITLPKLGKSILRSIELGKFVRPTDFAWKGRSLRYFRSLLDKIFCRKTGLLLPDFCVVAVNSLRQLSEYFYKLALDYEPKERSASEKKYLAVKHELETSPIDFDWTEKLRKNAETYYSDLFVASPDYILSHGVRHGPGTFAGATDLPKGLTYYAWKELPDEVIGTASIEQRPYSGYFKPYPSSPTPVRLVKTKRECEVTFVSKDSRGPRVISKEPPHLLRAQMAFFSWASNTLEKVTAYTINFRSQETNRLLAKEGSLKPNTWATVDLKDASDRVSIRLARRVFANSAGVRWFLNHQRSTTFKLPSGLTGNVSSVSGMGSGLTFPLLAFFVQLSVCTEVSSTFGLDYELVRSSVYVYGDDLVIPCRWYEAASRGLTKSLLMINNDKSFVNGPFRESCGGDYISGNDCSPVRLKLSNLGLPSRKSIEETVELAPNGVTLKALVSHTHELRRSGLNDMASYLECVIGKTIPMPYVGYLSPVLGRYTWDSSLIYQQGKGRDCSAPDGYIKAAMVKPVQHRLSRCPYKYLSPRIKPKESPTLPWLEDSRPDAPFGSISKPRDLGVSIRKISVLAALARG